MDSKDLGTGRRAEIIVAAANLFEEVGFYNTSMDDIAAAIGIRKPTLYHHVKSKGQIVAWIHNALADELLDRLKARIDSGMSSADNIYWVLYDILESVDARPGHLRVYFEHHREVSKEYRRDADKRRRLYKELVTGVVQAGMDSGEFKVDDVNMTTLALFGMSNWSYQWYQPGGRLSAEEVALHFWRIFMNGISKKPVSKAPKKPKV